LPEWCLEIPTDISIELSISLQLKVSIQVSSSIAVPRLHSQWAISCQLTLCQKELLFQTVKEKLVTEGLLLEPVAHQQSSLGILTMERRPELDFQVEAGEQFLGTAEP